MNCFFALKPRVKLLIVTSMVILSGGVVSQALCQSRACNDPTPAATGDEMFDAIYACWSPPEDSEGLGVRLRFILRKDGELRGKVVAVWLKPQEDSPRRRAFVESAIEAVNRATPVPFTEDFASKIAGVVLEPRFTFGE